MTGVDSVRPTRTFREVLEEELADPVFRAEWERLAPARAVALRLVRYRSDHDLTQTDLARKLGMSQPAIARLEAGEHVPSIETLVRLTERLGMSFQVEIRPAGHEQRSGPSVDGAAKIVQHVTTQAGAELLVAAS